MESENEQTTTDSAGFLENLKSKGNQYIAVQSVLDALDLWNSSIKLYFDAIDAETSTDALNAWLTCPIGATCFFSGAALICGFAYLGNGLNNQQQFGLSKLADSSWPYFRDMLKGLKWTFKGTRSFMIVASVLGQYQFLNYLAPIGLGLGVLSACNRMWNRHMVENRKSMQESNDRFRRQVKGINACFLEVKKDLVFDDNGNARQDVLKHIYAGSILKIATGNEPDVYDYYIVDGDGNCTRQNSSFAKHTFITALNREINPTNANREINTTNAKRIYWEQFAVLLNTHSIGNPSDQLDYFDSILGNKKTYIEKLLDPDSETSKFVRDQAHFQKDPLTAYASAGFSGLLNAPYYFLGILSMVVLPHPIFIAAVVVCSVFMLLNIAAELYQENDYQRRLKISQLKANLVKAKRLLILEWQQVNLYVSQKPSLLNSREANVALNYKIELLYNQAMGDEDCKYSTEEEVLVYLGVHRERIKKYEREYACHSVKLKDELQLNKDRVCWQGVRNGLVVFGAFNGLLMTIASMKFIFGIGFVPMFFYASIIAGIILTLCICFYTIYCLSGPKDNSNDEIDDAGDDAGDDVNLQNIFIAESTQKILNEKAVKPSKNLLITENAEVFRQLLSGFKKGMKLLQTLSVYLPKLPSGGGILAALSLIAAGISCIAAGLMFAVFFALKGLKGLMRVDEPKDSVIYQILTAGGFNSIYQFFTGHQSQSTATQAADGSAKPTSSGGGLEKIEPTSPKFVEIFTALNELAALRSNTPSPPPPNPSTLALVSI